MIFKIGTRGSMLALAQAQSVRDRLAQYYPEHTFQIVTVKTTGDRISHMPMRDIGTKGIFTKELEEHLLSGELDLAVHSMKDMPSELPGGLELAEVWKREDPRDVLILREAASLEELPAGAVIGSGSPRRKFQLLALRPDLQVVDIRGNIDTRLRKLEEQKLDGIVLAAAGLIRLGMENRITQFLNFQQMLPAPAQGAIAIEIASHREDIRQLLAPFQDAMTSRAVMAERQFLTIMGGGCHQPIGAIAQAQGEDIALRVMYGSENGEDLAFAEVRGQDPFAIAQEAAERIRSIRQKGDAYGE